VAGWRVRGHAVRIRATSVGFVGELLHVHFIVFIF
jgi:hypothetical protein